MRFLILVLLLSTAIPAQFKDNGKELKELETYILKEHEQIKEGIAYNNPGTDFQWKIAGFASFPNLKNISAPYFSDRSRYRSVLDRKAAYVESDTSVLVGTRFWFNTGDVPDTMYYRIIVYNYNQYTGWNRSYSHSTYVVVRGEVTLVKGNEEY